MISWVYGELHNNSYQQRYQLSYLSFLTTKNTTTDEIMMAMTMIMMTTIMITAMKIYELKQVVFRKYFSVECHWNIRKPCSFR